MPKTSERLLMLLSLLQARPEWPGALLAERLAVSPRTVRRDVDRLRALGYPIAAVKGPAGGYRLDAGTRLPPLLFDDEQAVALAIALRTAAASGAGIGEAAARALHTVRQVMPQRLRHRIDAVEAVAVESTAVQLVDTATLLAVSNAVRAHEVLRFDYRSAPVPRRVEPHHLVTRRGRWYLVGWDLDRADWRIFRADRITPRTPTGPRFTPRELPADSVAAFVTARFRGADSTTGSGDWPCQGQVILDLPAAEVAPFAYGGLVEVVGPRRCRLTLISWSWVGLASAVGLFDADIEVVGPPELAAAFATLARRYATVGQPTDTDHLPTTGQ
ncbi:transcriptional regulator [Solwaraspora sp. WMMD791]|uniref:helix-turn-helix transcriptional regulator n=1 Tax=Solwaraspora sp. WMMD791 TaxID=3016086 RepID=UPI00249BB8F2|nr:transcriptional regulator [Solwaraspora sp. WMMD791]WFE26350.1 transcriptional regulator [Solwaraspora sp. WMMD791]